MVDGGEVGTVSAFAEGAQKEDNFLSGEDVREGFFALDFDLGPNLPFRAEVVSVEGAQGTDGLVDRAPGQAQIGLEMKKEVEDLPAL